VLHFIRPASKRGPTGDCFWGKNYPAPGDCGWGKFLAVTARRFVDNGRRKIAEKVEKVEGERGSLCERPILKTKKKFAQSGSAWTLKKDGSREGKVVPVHLCGSCKRRCGGGGEK